MLDNASIPIITLGAVFTLISIRQIFKARLDIWQIMLMGALAVLLTGQISPINALLAINLDVMIFLAGMFIIGQAMYESGYLLHLSYKLFRRAENLDKMVILILFCTGILSAFLMNDTLAIIGTPLVLYLARVQSISPKLMLLSLAFGITTGSVMSPIGNPQNLLIAINSDLTNPFLTFFRYLLVPTAVNLFAAYVLLRLMFRDQFIGRQLSYAQEPVQDPELASASRLAFILLIILVTAKIASVLLGAGPWFRLTYISLASSLPVLLLSPRRGEIIRKIDWHTLIFFASMFVLMDSVWRTDFFQSIMNDADITASTIPAILVLSILLSQLISNVPFVALYMPLLSGTSVANLMALAAGSTIAGNLFILGAASNVIIIQRAEKCKETLTFLDFARAGVPLTIINAVVYWIFLRSC